MDQDRVMYELDMERMYEDESFTLDEANRLLQEETAVQLEEATELAYDEYLQSILSRYYE